MAELTASVLTVPALRRVNDFIAISLDQQISLADLAQVAGKSRFHFLRLFTRAVGMTPARYVMHRRSKAAISMASALTHSDDSQAGPAVRFSSHGTDGLRNRERIG